MNKDITDLYYYIKENMDKGKEIQEDPLNIPLPLNSLLHIQKENTSRFKTAHWFTDIQKQSITLIGVGGIGSYVALLLSRLQIQSLQIYDSDKVDYSNLSGQLFSKTDIEEYKVNAISQLIKNYADFTRLFPYNTAFTSDTTTLPIVICGVDNMKTRGIAFNSWKNSVNKALPEDLNKYLFIDGRLAAEEFQVFCIKGTDTFNIKNYTDNYLFKDEEAEATICSYKQTSFCASMIGAIITNLVVNFTTNLGNPLINRDLPFLTEYKADLMYLKTKA